MTDQDTSYRPQSPDFSSFQSSFPQPLTSPLAHRASYDASPFFAPQYHHHPSAAPSTQHYVPPFTDSYFDSDMARRSSRIAQAADDPHAPAPKYEEPMSPPEPIKPTPSAGVEVKTKFPVARIKRIMQADEDVGKVAQVTPIAVCTCRVLLFPPPTHTNDLQRKHWNSS